MEWGEIPGFGETVALFRKRARMSQEKLAKALGKQRRSIAAWETGEYLPKTKGDVLELARILALNNEETTTLLKAAGIDPSLAIWNLPFPRNPFFIGRDQELEQLHTQLQQGTTAVGGQAQSISGLGGIGKTQLAIEYAYRYHNEYQRVLWARAESVEALTSSFIEIACLLNLPEKDAEAQVITIEAVKRWLRQQRGWLLILDNANSPTLLLDFLPPTVRGHLLITTRAVDVSAHLMGFAHPLVVETFSDELGALFLLRRSDLLALDATLDQAEIDIQQLALSIAHELGGLPLALDQAGAYLKATNSSLITYQRIYQQHRAQLLKERRGAYHSESVATTWNISFRCVEQQNPAAADLLRLCAFLAPDAIPEAIITEGAPHLGPHLAPIGADPYLLNQAVEVLRAYSLLRREAGSGVETLFSVHRLVQVVLKEQTDQPSRIQWAERVVRAVNAALPLVEYRRWPQWERILPHAQQCAKMIVEHQFTFSEVAYLLNGTSTYLYKRARYQESEPLMEYVLAIFEQQAGSEYPDTATCLNNLANLYQDQGKYTEAESLYKRALSISERQQGEVHPDTAGSLNNLANLYQDQGKYTEAELLLKRALTIFEQQMGSEHPDTAASINNLALLYSKQERYAEAEPLFKRALSISEQHLGEMYSETATCLNNLALLYEDQGKHAEAEPLLERALSISEQHLGEMHPTTAMSLNNLALLYKGRGKYAGAEPLYKRALAIREQQQGEMHPETATCLNNLGSLYYEQGKYTEAELLLERALAIREQYLGEMHPDTAVSLNNLFCLYIGQRKFAEAKLLLGLMHPNTESQHE